MHALSHGYLLHQIIIRRMASSETISLRVDWSMSTYMYVDSYAYTLEGCS